MYPQLSKVEYLNPRQDAVSVVAFSTEKVEQAATEGEAPAPAQGQPKISKDLLKAMVLYILVHYYDYC